MLRYGSDFLRLRNEPPEGFDAPWQAEAYGISQALIESGHVSSDQWASAMNKALRRNLYDQGLPDTAETYSIAVVEALGEVTSTNGIVSRQELEQRAEAWRSSYERTPHGKPVKLCKD